MTSGRPITEVERRQILRMNATDCPMQDIAIATGLERQTVTRVIREAAKAWWEHVRRVERASDLLDRDE